jgi:hypothetical protein
MDLFKSCKMAVFGLFSATFEQIRQFSCYQFNFWAFFELFDLKLGHLATVSCISESKFDSWWNRKQWKIMNCIIIRL